MKNQLKKRMLGCGPEDSASVLIAVIHSS